MIPLKIKPIGFGSVTRTRHASPGNVVVATTHKVIRDDTAACEERAAHHKMHPPAGIIITPITIGKIFGRGRNVVYAWFWIHKLPYFKINKSMVGVEVDSLMRWACTKPNLFTEDELSNAMATIRKMKGSHEQPPKG